MGHRVAPEKPTSARPGPIPKPMRRYLAEGGMSKPHKKNPEDFPEFYPTRLMDYADEWVGNYSAIQIERVVLYRYNTKPYAFIKSIAKRRTDELSKSLCKDSHPVQYAIVFKISNCVETLDTYPEDYLYYPSNIKYVSEDAAKGTPIENLLPSPENPEDILPIPEDPEDIACIEFMKDCKQAYRYDSYNRPHPFLDPAFRKVYKTQAIEDFKKEWVFFYKRPNDHLDPNILTDKPFWVLYGADVRPIQSPKVIELLKKVRPEIESIFAEIKKVGFTSQVIDEKEWMKAALNQFDNNNFEYIKREYLEDKQIYFFSGGQEKRDFIGKVLKEIIKKNGLGTFGYQLLYNIYKSIID